MVGDISDQSKSSLARCRIKVRVRSSIRGISIAPENRHIAIPFFGLRIEHFEKFDQLAAELRCREFGHIVVEQILVPENARILGIETEDQTDAQLVQRFLAFGFVGREIGLAQPGDFLLINFGY